jgi:hypothetical protein
MNCKGKYHDPQALRTITYLDGRRVQMCKKCECTVEDVALIRQYQKNENPFKA